MFKATRTAAVAGLILAGVAAEAGAQGWGGGGFGFAPPLPYNSTTLYGDIYPGSTAPGDILRSGGIYWDGRGSYELRHSQAEAIRVRSSIEWDSYVDYRQRQAWWQYGQRVERKHLHHRTLVAQDQERKCYNANGYDVQSGNALNALLTELTRPGTYVGDLAEARVAVPTARLRAIPLNYNACGIRVRLDQLGGPGRDATRFRDEVVAADPEGFAAFQRALQASPEMPLADLLAFMDRFGLRFGDSRRTSGIVAFYSLLYKQMATAHRAVNPPPDAAPALAVQ